MERLIDIEEFKKFKQSRLYKLVDLFWTDDQKSCILENGFIFGFALLSKIKYLRNELMDGDQLYIVRTEKHYFLILKESKTGNLVFAGPPKTTVVVKEVGFYQQWKEMNLPRSIVEMVEKSQNMKDIKKSIQKMMTMKAFW